jgi:hypothetical protein
MRHLLVVLAAALLGPGAPAAYAQIKIAAVGASTTRGSGAPAGQSYPDQLQRLLGSGYEVRNFGKSGAGVLRKGNPTYWNSPEHRAATDFGPDIVVDWLGGADSKAASWDNYKGEFLADYMAMIEHFKALPSRPKVICMISVARYDDAGVRKAVLEAEVNPLQRRGAEETDSRIIDVKSLVDGHPEYFADGVHLNAMGYAAVARAVEREVRALNGAADAGASDGAAGTADAALADAGGQPEAVDAGNAGAPVAGEDANGRPASTAPPRDAAAAETPPPPASPKGNSGSSGGFGCAVAPSGAGVAFEAGAVAALVLALMAAVARRRRRQEGVGQASCNRA